MKRTQDINQSQYRKKNPLFLLTPVAIIVAGALYYVSLPSDEPMMEASIYLNEKECIVANPNLSNECSQAYSTALIEAQNTAPKYDSLASCEAEFGADACVSTPPSEATAEEQPRQSSMFMPIMAGYMMGRMMGGGYSNSPMFTSSAAGSAMNGKFYDAAGRNYGTTTARSNIKVPTTAFNPKPVTSTTTTRGGFGQMVSKHAAVSPTNNMSKGKSTPAFSGGRTMGG